MSSDDESGTDESGSDVEIPQSASVTTITGSAYNIDGNKVTPEDKTAVSPRSQRAKKSLKRTDCRYRIRECLDNPHSSWVAFFFGNCMVLLICASVVTLMLSTLPASPINPDVDFILEAAFNYVFTVEFVIRLFLIEECARGFTDPYMYFDLISIIPFWIEFFNFVQGGVALDMLKAFKMLRLLKLSRQYDGSIILMQAIDRSREALGVPFFFLGVAVVIFSAFMYYTEKAASQHTNATAAYDSIPHAVWFVITTMTTVGYGDVTPVTPLGKTLAGVMMVFGVLFLSMPLAIVGQNFVTIWNDRERIIFIQRLKQSLLDNDVSKVRITELFHKLDSDGSGLLSFKEFRIALERLNIKMTSGQLMKLWWAVDKDQNGEVSHDEFLHVVFPETEAQDDDDINDLDEADLTAVVDASDAMLTRDTRMVLTQMGALRTELLAALAALHKDVRVLNDRMDAMQSNRPNVVSTTKSVSKKEVIYS